MPVLFRVFRSPGELADLMISIARIQSVSKVVWTEKPGECERRVDLYGLQDFSLRFAPKLSRGVEFVLVVPS